MKHILTLLLLTPTLLNAENVTVIDVGDVPCLPGPNGDAPHCDISPAPDVTETHTPPQPDYDFGDTEESDVAVDVFGRPLPSSIPQEVYDEVFQVEGGHTLAMEHWKAAGDNLDGQIIAKEQCFLVNAVYVASQPLWCSLNCGLRQ